MSDDDAVTAVIPQQVQRPVQPNTAPMANPRNAKQNADDAGWSPSLSNQDKDLDNEDSNKSVYKAHTHSAYRTTTTAIQCEEKTRDVNTFFGKSYAHKVKDGRRGHPRK
ncbi:uncharacterized protein EDB93DRAFT_1099440 [Suillus bovinus]|uniref:uncharacterized protein n=1 Tax=Suillus bovinus TaxID=48563 RepID=UPI001B8790AA|nr:uncharacterized protein EDB93DRAFT_1099440 [Suillus bovinus]KAG2160045.1 hypothetical protein EDB93DRAFT_1099440 [Suillus bovinus]